MNKSSHLKGYVNTCLILAAFVSYIPVSAHAVTATGNLTSIYPSPHEPDLTGSGGILDITYGLGNLQRIDDDLDQYWNVSANEVTVTAVAKYAVFSQDFGFIDNNDNFTSLLLVPYMNSQSNTFTIIRFRFAV